MIKLIPLRKPKSQYFYVLLSSVLVFSGLLLVFNADYSNTPNNVIVLNEPEDNLEVGNEAPEYLIKTEGLIEVCRLSSCSGFDIYSKAPINGGKKYLISPVISAIPKLVLDANHQNFKVGLLQNNLYICSDMYCWMINDGVNNIFKSDVVLNSAQLEVLNFRW